jgi:hypothetical protein
VEEPVKPDTARGVRRLLPRRKRSRNRSDGATQPEPDFDPVEFAEFLEADDGPLPVDPDFKEALRERLWELVRPREPRDDVPGPADSPPPRRRR